MTRVRASARCLADAVSGRGWGGGLLYGLGEPGKWEVGVDNDANIDELVQTGQLDADWADCREPATQPDGRRVSYQARVDFIVTDEVALRAHARRRLMSQDQIQLDEDLLIRNPFLVLTCMDGIEHMDYSEAGLEAAGGQSLAKTVDRALWDLEDDSQDDAFPTARP